MDNEFFDDPKNYEILKDVLVNKTVSLRIIDWFVTNYIKDHQVFICEKNIEDSYKSALKRYKKKLFDPFKRNIKNIMTFKDLATTQGQLNFFEWAIKMDIIEYIKENMEKISGHMKRNQERNKKKRIVSGVSKSTIINQRIFSVRKSKISARSISN